MDSQSLYQVLYIFLDWHPARIKTFAELICAVVKANCENQRISAVCHF